jgi:monoamine oxidase
MSPSHPRLTSNLSRLLPRPAHYHAVVVGAGVSGLRAASRLIGEGLDVLTLEAKPQVGGRVTSATLPNGTRLDLGAAWYHGVPQNPAAQLALGAGHTLLPTRYRTYLDTRRIGERHPYARAENAFEERVEGSLERGEDRPLSDLLGRGRFAQSIGYFAAQMNSAADPEATSSKDIGLALERPESIPREGMTALVDLLAEGVPVQTDSPVKHLDWTGPRVVVRTPHRTVTADKVVLTVSTAVAKKLPIRPSLPAEHEAALEALPMGVMNKIALEFDRDVFGTGDNCGVVSASTRGDDTYFLLNPGGQHAAVMFTGGNQAADWEKRSDADHYESALHKLSGLFGEGVREHVLPGGVVTRWGEDPFTGGSFSAALPGCADQRGVLGQPIDEKLFFAGEATAPSELAASVAGAIHSGDAVARKVLDSFARARCPAPLARPIL